MSTNLVFATWDDEIRIVLPIQTPTTLSHQVIGVESNSERLRLIASWLIRDQGYNAEQVEDILKIIRFHMGDKRLHLRLS